MTEVKLFGEKCLQIKTRACQATFVNNYIVCTVRFMSWFKRFGPTLSVIYDSDTFQLRTNFVFPVSVSGFLTFCVTAFVLAVSFPISQFLFFS